MQDKDFKAPQNRILSQKDRLYAQKSITLATNQHAFEQQKHAYCTLKALLLELKDLSNWHETASQICKYLCMNDI